MPDARRSQVAAALRKRCAIALSKLVGAQLVRALWLDQSASIKQQEDIDMERRDLRKRESERAHSVSWIGLGLFIESDRDADVEWN